MRVCRCRRFASKAIERTPLTGRNCPDNASSPVMQYASRAGKRLFSSSFSMPRAIGRSKLGPSFRTSARGQVDPDPLSVGLPQRAVGNGGGDPIFALFDRGIRQSDYRDLVGVPPSGMDFDLDLIRLDTDNRCGIN